MRRRGKVGQAQPVAGEPVACAHQPADIGQMIADIVAGGAHRPGIGRPAALFHRHMPLEYALADQRAADFRMEFVVEPARQPAHLDPFPGRRRLASWFNDKFHSEVSGPLVSERVFKRHMTVEQGGGPPDTGAMRAARHNIRYHLAYIGWLVRTRDWLAGDRLSLADLAAAADRCAADYLGDVPWTADEASKNWYARVKSRPSFRTILADTLAGLPPAKSYADLDF